MTRTAHTVRMLIAAAAALALVPAAMAGGEPKNQAPFTRPASSHKVVVRGEAKNQMPFKRPLTGTRAATGSAPTRRGQHSGTRPCEPKNQAPFTRRPARRRTGKVARDWFERYAHAHQHGSAAGSGRS
jgi:hypothetical protein